MEISNSNPEYVDRVQGILDVMHCPVCGGRAVIMAMGWSPQSGTYYVAPIFCCGTPGCEYSLEGPSTWTPVLRL